MQEIKFDLGGSIAQVARASGVPAFQTENINGSIQYSVAPVPEEVKARFTRAGYEVALGPLFAFSLDADKRRSADELVEKATLQIAALKSHEAAKTFTEQLISQFQSGKWTRQIPGTCPAVTGRSSLLNESGQLDTETLCPLAPEYKLSQDEWLAMMGATKFYRWKGDGVAAELEISRGRNAEDGVRYDLWLRFELEAVQEEHRVHSQTDLIRQGEANGWGTAAKVAANERNATARAKRLEAMALQRGDRVLNR